MEQNKFYELFELFRKVELAQQTRFSFEMAYEKRIQQRDIQDNEDNDNDDGNTNDNG